MAANGIEMIALHAPARDSCFKTAMTSTAACQHQRHRQRDALMQEMMQVASTSASVPLRSRRPALLCASKIIAPEFKLCIWYWVLFWKEIVGSTLKWRLPVWLDLLSASPCGLHEKDHAESWAAPSTQPLTSSQTVAGYQSWTSPWSPDDSDAPGDEVLNWSPADVKVQPLVSHLESSEGINSFCLNSFQLRSPAALEDPIIQVLPSSPWPLVSSPGAPGSFINTLTIKAFHGKTSKAGFPRLSSVPLVFTDFKWRILNFTLTWDIRTPKVGIKNTTREPTSSPCLFDYFSL